MLCVSEDSTLQTRTNNSRISLSIVLTVWVFKLEIKCRSIVETLRIREKTIALSATVLDSWNNKTTLKTQGHTQTSWSRIRYLIKNLENKGKLKVDLIKI
jgi:hypothetical protein